jgi:hypothetical protein
MAEKNITIKTGKFTITTGAPGAPVIVAYLSVYSEDGAGAQAVGYANYTQVVSPPFIAFPSFLKGPVYATGFKTTQQLYALQGTAPSGLLGAKHIATLAISLEGIWGTSGHAAYTVYDDTPHPPHQEKVPVKVEWV